MTFLPVLRGKVAARILMICIAAMAAVELQHAGHMAAWSPLASQRTIIYIVALAAFFLTRTEVPSASRNLPAPRNSVLRAALPALLGCFIYFPAFSHPYLADDYLLLAARGGATSLSELFAIPEWERFFRPAGWVFWWICYQLGGDDPFFGHLTSCAVFMTQLIVMPVALRRLGAPRGVAFVASLLHACSPMVFETTLWVTNQFSLLAGLFCTVSLATLPPRRNWWIFVSTAAGFMAYLSKEESFLLPFVAWAAAARFRPSRWMQGLAIVWPLFAALAAALALRFAVIGRMGGYDDPAGQSALVSGLISGPARTFSSEDLSKYLFPRRYETLPFGLDAVFGFVPLVLLWCAMGSPVARRCVARGILIFFMFVAPALPMFPIGEYLQSARWLYLSMAGLSLAAAGCLGSMPGAGAMKMAAVAAFVCLAIGVGRVNLRAWDEAGRVMRRGQELMTPILAGIPRDSTAFVVGLPTQVDGVHCYNCATGEALSTGAKRRDVRVADPWTAVGPLAVAKWMATPDLEPLDLLEETPRWAARTGETIRVNFGKVEDVGSLRIHALFDSIHPSGVARSFLAFGPPSGAILLPCLEVEPGMTLTLTPDVASVVPPRGIFVPCILYRDNKTLHREVIPWGTPFTVPPHVHRVRVDVTIKEGVTVALREISIAAAGPRLADWLSISTVLPANSAPAPVLSATGKPGPGNRIVLHLKHAPPGSTVQFVAGLSRIDRMAGSFLVVPNPDMVWTGATDTLGESSTQFVWPEHVPRSATAYLQAAVVDKHAAGGQVLTNALRSIE